MKKSVLAVSMVIAAACGVDGQQAGDEAAATPAPSTQRQGLTYRPSTVPTTPASPTEFVSYYRLHDGRMIPLGVSSAYMVVYQAPGDATSFIAFAYDVTSYRNIFYLHGSLATDLPRLTSIVASETLPNTANSPLSWLDWGVFGQVRGPPPPPDPIGGMPQTAWNALNASYSAVHY